MNVPWVEQKSMVITADSAVLLWILGFQIILDNRYHLGIKLSA